MGKAIFIGLALLAAAVFVHRDTALLLSGFRPLEQPAAADLDGRQELEDRNAKAFFDRRNVVEVEVPRAMTAREFLDLWVIDQPHVRRQIAEAEGLPKLTDETPLTEGTVYRIVLTPPDDATP